LAKRKAFLDLFRIDMDFSIHLFFGHTKLYKTVLNVTLNAHIQVEKIDKIC